jgi:YD repeat-containing protein
VNDAASTPLDLSSTTRVTLEFWLNWDAYANDDRLAMEFTPNFNDGTGGFLVDPNSPQGGGKFGLGLGNGLSRNDAYFNRPSAGTWHYYAIVLDAGATATNQITPYVDGQPVAYTKSATGVGGGSFANSQLYLMSRAASSLFGAGDLDELAIYRRSLTPAEIADHYDAGFNNPPKAAFTISPTKANPGQTVTYNASGSSDTDGSIAKYEWDLDGNGSYETSTGTTPTVTKAYATPGTYQIGLRVTDNEGSTATATSPLTVQQPPTASFTLSPNPSQQGQTVTFNGAASSDPDGTVVKYEWDLDGNGTFETNTGTTPTTTKSYPTGGTYQIGLRVTDNNGATGQTTKALNVHRPPVASFTVSPSPATTRQTVTFNGSASTDADGPIAEYEWDLDGNGTYETNTGTTPTGTKTYTTPGTLTLRLRVTDGDGITNETTRTLTINSLYRQTVLGTSGLRGFWRLGETSGTNANDESPNNRDGTYQNTPGLGATGLLAGDTDRAVDFNRSQSERVTIGDNSVFDPTTVSLEAWVRNDSSLSGTTNRAIIAKSNSSQSDHAWSLEYRRSSGVNQLVFTVTTSSQTEYAVTQTLNTGTTYHIVATYDGSSMRIYVNGAQVGSGRSKTGSIRNSGQSLQLGAIGSSDHWDGVLDETAVYGSALSAATVLAHYNAGKP